MSQTVAVDFDGVIHAYTQGWRDGTIYDPPLPGALEGLRALMDEYAVFIHTSRAPDQVADWLIGHRFDAITHTQWARELSRSASSNGGRFWNDRGRVLVTSLKLPAVAYVDDRAVRFSGWATVRDQLRGALTTEEPPAAFYMQRLEQVVMAGLEGHRTPEQVLWSATDLVREWRDQAQADTV